MCPAATVATLGEVEGQVGEVLRTRPVSLCFQDATNEAMQASPPHRGDLDRETLAHFIVAEGKGVLWIRSKKPHPYSCQQRLFCSLGVLTEHLGEEGDIEGASNERSGA